MVGREAEKAHIKSLLKSDEHEFVAVFGRRRIGKELQNGDVYRRITWFFRRWES